MKQCIATYSIEEIRSWFPALKRVHNGKTVAYFDGPGGGQAHQKVLDAMSGYMMRGSANIHAQFPSSVETDAMLIEGRKAIAALFNADWEWVSYGANATSLMFQVSRALKHQWQEGDEIILTEMEHHSNIDTWRMAAEEVGVTVKYIPVDTATLTLDMSVLPSLLSDRTRLVAVGVASNVIGTINDVKEACRLAHSVGALFSVDAVHAIPHLSVDMKALDIDMLFASSYKFFGPHMGMSVIRKEILDQLYAYKVMPANNDGPDRLETGTQNLEGVAALPATVDFIAGFGEGSTLTERVKTGYARIEEYENALASHLRKGLADIPGVTLYQAGDDVPKTPTVAYTVDKMSCTEFCRRASEEYSLFVSDGDFYGTTLVRKIVPGDDKSVIRAGVAPYNTMEEVDRLINATREILA